MAKMRKVDNAKPEAKTKKQQNNLLYYLFVSIKLIKPLTNLQHC